jgi:hypothetical protein
MRYGKLADRGRTLQQALDYRQAGGIAKGIETDVNMLVHMVKLSAASQTPTKTYPKGEVSLDCGRVVRLQLRDVMAGSPSVLKPELWLQRRPHGVPVTRVIFVRSPGGSPGRPTKPEAGRQARSLNLTHQSSGS